MVWHKRGGAVVKEIRLGSGCLFQRRLGGILGERARAIGAVLADYSRTTTLHGVAFVGNESAGLLER